MTRLEKNRQLTSKRGKEGTSNYFSVLNFFLPIFVLWFSILNKSLIMDSLIGIIKLFVSPFFTMFSFFTSWNYPSHLWLFGIFREYRGVASRRNKSSFLTHFSQVFLFCTAWLRQKTLSLLLFQGGIKSEYWEELGKIISHLC